MIGPEASAAARLKDLGVHETVEFNSPPRPEMGDFSSPIALKLRKIRGQAPLVIAEEIRAGLESSLPRYIRDVTVTPPGFLNFFVDHRAFAADLIRESYGPVTPIPPEDSGKVEVEHTNVNPNKAMHVGHVRNAVLGDTIVRALRAAGRQVEVCNYIDDTGIQVVDVVTAFLYLEAPYYVGGEDFSEIWAKAPSDRPFDYYCWDIYAAVQSYLKPDPAAPLDAAEQSRATLLQERKAEITHAIEAGDTAIAHFAKALSSRIVRAHLRTAARLNVFYNLLNWESDILRAGFWDHTFQRLKEAGAIQFEESGLNKGCWVVPMGGTEETPEGARSRDKILVRSNGAITYTAKDIAYQLWKFGKLDTDFRYELWDTQANGEPLWTTAWDGEPREGFGRAARVINVIDVRQSEPQTVVYKCLDSLGFKEEARNSTHLSYEVVTLSAQAAAELGVDVEEGQDVSMSGRKGLGVKADDLIDRMAGVIRSRSAEATLDAEALAAAAIRYYMLRFSTNTRIRFDFEVASQTNGDTGVYLVYSFARACSILAKAGEGSGRPDEFVVPRSLSSEEKDLLREMGRLPQAIQSAAESLTTTPLTTYAFSLASAFAGFYDHTPPILREPDPDIRQFRLSLVGAFREVMKKTLSILGIPALERI